MVGGMEIRFLSQCSSLSAERFYKRSMTGKWAEFTISVGEAYWVVCADIEKGNDLGEGD